MTEVLQSREFIGITNGGAAEGGNTVYFELQFEGDERVVFNCDHSLIAKLLGNIRQYGAMADSVRKNEGKPPLEVSAPYFVDTVKRAGHSEDGQTIALQMTAEEGFPLEIAMTPDQARRVIQLLQTELIAAAKPPAPDRRN
jgi:hypothetical protein